MSEAGRPLRPPMLDARLHTIAQQLPDNCGIAADIGADHGRLSCYLLHHGICREMIVSDISPQALQKAKKLLEKHGLQGRARFVTADGLDAIEGKVDAVIISGMGGSTIAAMLRQAHGIQGARLILSAHTQTALLRQAIYQAGYRIDREIVVQAAGRYYTVLVAEQGQGQADARALAIGRSLQASPSASVADYLAWRLQVLLAARRGQHDQEIEWLKEEIEHAKRKESNNL